MAVWWSGGRRAFDGVLHPSKLTGAAAECLDQNADVGMTCTVVDGGQDIALATCANGLGSSAKMENNQSQVINFFMWAGLFFSFLFFFFFYLTRINQG